MILKVRDITDPDGEAVGHVQTLPDGYTLADVFDKNDELKQISKHVVSARFNDLPTADWKSLRPQKGDVLVLDIMPGEGITLGVLLTVVSVVISAVQLILSLINSPGSTKQKTGARESTVYGFEGIRDTLAPGNPIPVVYGRMRVGIQVLMYYVDVTNEGRGNSMHMLCGVCEGPIACIKDVEINGIQATDLTSVSVVTRLGNQVQTVIPGFETIKNTFSDGREVTTASIVYQTISNVTQSVDVQVGALEGLIYIKANKKTGQTKQLPNTIYYSIEMRSIAGAWTTVENRQFSGQTFQRKFESVAVQFPNPGQYQIRLTWTGAAVVDDQNSRYKLWVTNVTEYGGSLGPHSSTALIGIAAEATSQLQGGRPNVTCLVLGKLVRVYSNVNTYSVGWTRNPAWNVLDYMTNSIYGMGGYVGNSNVDIQSFVDFANLCNSRAIVCP